MGGKAAMQFALSYPHRVESLIVIDIAPVLYPPHHNEILAGMQNLDLDILRSREEADQQLVSYVPELAVRQFLLENLVKDESGRLQWRINLDVIQRDYQQIMAGQELLLRNHQVQNPYSGPVLFLKGGNSEYIRAEHWPVIQHLFPAAVMRIISNTGHWLHAEKPEVTAAVIRRFLQTPT
jgi:esterase